MSRAFDIHHWFELSYAQTELFEDRLNILVSEVNDEGWSDYPQKTPKGRILAALREIQKKGKKK